MVSFRKISNVRRLEETVEAYLVDIEIDFGEGLGFERTEYPARSGGGGICDAVLRAIQNGAFSGEITDNNKNLTN